MAQVPETISGVAEKATMAGSAGTVVGWATSSDLGMWAGILIGITGVIVNWYFKRKSDRRNQEIHDAYLAKLNASIPVAPVEGAE